MLGGRLQPKIEMADTPSPGLTCHTTLTMLASLYFLPQVSPAKVNEG